MAELLACENLKKSMGHRVLFDGLSLKIHDKEHVGLIGPNGSGKSTFLKILSGDIDADDGEVVRRKAVRLIYLPQIEIIKPDMTIIEAALDISKNDIMDDYEREAQASMILGQIGFADLNQKVGNISGGWMKRLSIARQLARNPDIMLLDEPTNHLDMEGIEWLEEYLKRPAMSYIIVTHDRRFLDRATNRIVELNDAFDGGMLSFNCSYDEYMRRRHDFLEAEQSRYESLSNKNRREQEWVRAGVKARTTKQKSRVQDAEVLKAEVGKLKKQTAEPDKVIIEFEATDRKTKRLIVAHGISKAFGEKIIVEDFDLVLTPGMRVGLLGNNGTGKTTLIKMLCGEEDVDSGGISVTTGCKILHFDQKRQLVDETQTLKEALSPGGADRVVYRDKNIHITSWAKKLKFKAEQLQLPVSKLSGGERARVIIGRLMLQTADVLLMDEPTNDLDIQSIEVLEESLLEFPGAIILVTHDREMLDRVSTVLMAFDGLGGVEPYASYDQWKRDTKKGAGGQSKKKESKQKPAEIVVEKKSITSKKLTYKDQYEWDNMDATIQKAEGHLKSLQGSPVLYADGQGKFSNYCAALETAQQDIDTLYKRWEDLEEKISGLK